MYDRQSPHLHYGGENLNNYLIPSPTYFPTRIAALRTNSIGPQPSHKGGGAVYMIFSFLWTNPSWSSFIFIKTDFSFFPFQIDLYAHNHECNFLDCNCNVNLVLLRVVLFNSCSFNLQVFSAFSYSFWSIIVVMLGKFAHRAPKLYWLHIKFLKNCKTIIFKKLNSWTSV
jgi:hypothetical protein